MRAALPLAFLLAALATIPTVAALDAFPGTERWGRHEARLLARAPEGGALRVSADAPIAVALAEPGATAGPARLAPTQFMVRLQAPNASWHGLPGTVEVVMWRADASRPVTLVVEDDRGTAEYTWPAAPRLEIGNRPMLASGVLAFVAFVRRCLAPL